MPCPTSTISTNDPFTYNAKAFSQMSANTSRRIPPCIFFRHHYSVYSYYINTYIYIYLLTYIIHMLSFQKGFHALAVGLPHKYVWNWLPHGIAVNSLQSIPQAWHLPLVVASFFETRRGTDASHHEKWKEGIRPPRPPPVRLARPKKPRVQI